MLAERWRIAALRRDQGHSQMIGLQVAKGLSDKQALRLLHAIIRFGDHFEESHRFRSNNEVRQRLEAEGYPFGHVLRALRSDRGAHIPKYENAASLPLASYVQHNIDGAVSQVSLVRGDGAILHTTTTGEPDRVFTGAEWQTLLGDALRAYAKTINESDRAAANSMLVNGFAAVEAFLNLEAHSFTIDNPGASLNEQVQRLTLKQKLDEWMPAMTGFKLELGDDCWQAVTRLSNVRNDGAVHPKPGSGLRTLRDIASVTNDFQCGICGLMFRLLFIFGHPVPIRLIRTMFDPPVTVASA